VVFGSNGEWANFGEWCNRSGHNKMELVHGRIVEQIKYGRIHLFVGRFIDLNKQKKQANTQKMSRLLC